MLTFFFDRSDDFSEIRDFVRNMDTHYGLHLHTMHGDFKAGVEHLVNVKGVKAIFLGTRRYFDHIPRAILCPSIRFVLGVFSLCSRVIMKHVSQCWNRDLVKLFPHRESWACRSTI